MVRRKTIFVVDATGAQGGSVACALPSRGRFDVRALTRNVQSGTSAGAACARRRRGAGRSRRSAGPRRAAGRPRRLRRDNFWEHFEPEEVHGRNLVDAVAAAMSPQTGANIRYTDVPREAFAALGFSGAADLADMFEYRLHIPRRAPRHGDLPHAEPPRAARPSAPARPSDRGRQGSEAGAQRDQRGRLAGPTGLEPATSGVMGTSSGAGGGSSCIGTFDAPHSMR